MANAAVRRGEYTYGVISSIADPTCRGKIWIVYIFKAISPDLFVSIVYSNARLLVNARFTLQNTQIWRWSPAETIHCTVLTILQSRHVFSPALFKAAVFYIRCKHFMKLWCWVPNQTFLHQVVVVRYRVTKLKFSVICIVPAVPIKSVFYGRQCWYRSPGTWEALNVPNAHGRRSFSFQIWFLETNKAGQCNKFKRRPIAVPRFIGRPVRATPNHKMEAASHLCSKKTKWRTELPEGFACPIPYQWGQFLQRGDRPAGGGGYFRKFWVGKCCWDPGTLNLYQS